jgi:hypothetical protein
MLFILDKTFPILYIEFKDIFKLLFRKHKVIVLNDEQINQLKIIINEYEIAKTTGPLSLRDKFSLSKLNK